MNFSKFIFNNFKLCDFLGIKSSLTMNSPGCWYMYGMWITNLLVVHPYFFSDWMKLARFEHWQAVMVCEKRVKVPRYGALPS